MAGAPYLFIDGGCLRATVQQISKEVCSDSQRIRPLLKWFGMGFKKSYYYDAVPAQERGEKIASYERRVENAHTEIDRIRSLDRFHVALGEIKGKRGNRRQKQVDVRLAVDMLTHAFKANFTEATLLAGDDDFIPLIETLVREGVEVTIWHPPQASEQLLASADNRREFSLATAHALLTVNGRNRAFYHAGSGSGGASQSEVPFSAWSHDGVEYIGRCTNDFIRVHRILSVEQKNWHQYKINGLTPEEAGRFFQAATGWPVNIEHLQGKAVL